MTDKEAIKLALEALEQYHSYMEPLTTVFGGPRVPAEQSTTGKVEKAITALRQALEQQPADEPVAWMYTSKLAGNQRYITRYQSELTTYRAEEVWPLYTRPQPAAWVGLTDEEMKQVCYETFSYDPYVIARAIEQTLKEKNT